ncbi:MAG: hypothetical protein MPK10_09640, partial [Gammaproteobacteria bacterium]|nr:hypothetical protein [Gammaproteobacteria bacterium]
GLGLVCNLPGIRKKSAKNKGKREKNKEKKGRKPLDCGKIAENPIVATEVAAQPNVHPPPTPHRRTHAEVVREFPPAFFPARGGAACRPRPAGARGGGGRNRLHLAGAGFCAGGLQPHSAGARSDQRRNRGLH